ncbi:MAG: FAD-dependent oxidoreductase [Pirellulales bacterium]
MIHYAMICRHFFLLAFVSGLFWSSGTAQASEPAPMYDIVIYGGNSAAVIAAVQAKLMGKTVIIVSPDKHLGGLSSGGLGWTDTGNKAVIGGLARDFYHRIWKHYQRPEAWRWQSQSEYGNKGQGNSAIDGAQRTQWIFEPHVAEAVFDELVREHGIELLRNEWLDRSPGGVQKENGSIKSIKTLSNRTIAGKMFIDATYEGDLMAAADIEYTIGRESIEKYGEKWNGIQTGVLHHRHHFGAVKTPISPYKIPGDRNSGLLPRISDKPPGEYGQADKRIQAYCFRMCLSNDPKNRTPFPKPEGYDASQYELMLRVLEAGWIEYFEKFDPIPNHKTDTNNHGPFSTDNIGFNWDYPEASYERRREIVREHTVYQQGLMYFLSNDSRVPKNVRDQYAAWGLAADEFEDNGNWPHQLYIREARRMVGKYVMTENELLGRRDTPESVGMGSYTIDSHNVQRYVTPEGFVQNEGDIGVGLNGPYRISYSSIIPQKSQCENLLVPVCVSSSHIAYGSIRMEPVFMILGQSAASAASLAIDKMIAVQDLAYEQLRTQLLKDGQVLEYTSPDNTSHRKTIPVEKLPGIVLDNSDAKLVGDWTSSKSGSSVGDDYLHDGNKQDGKATATYERKLASGKYKVRLSYAQNSNRSSQVRVTVFHAGGKSDLIVNQKKTPSIDGLWTELGVFEFRDSAPARVVISNQDANGYVILDAVQFVQ